MIIRASSLPAYNDCARRTVAQNYRELVAGAGFPVRESTQHIGAVIGTAFHVGVASILRDIQADCNVSLDQARARAVESLRAVTTWIPDNYTKDLQTAEFQLLRMLDAWLPVGLTMKPAQVEQKLAHPAGDGFTLQGHMDLRTVEGVIHDHKTGTRKSNPAAQLGAYSLLARANGLPVTGISRDYTKRSAKTKDQDELVQERFNVRECELAAHHTIDQIKTDVEKFQKTGDPWAFRANPNTILCTEKLCPVWGTKFCTMGR